MKRALSYIAAIVLAAATARAGADADSVRTLRPVTSSYWIEHGTAHIADTYLTPLHYRGSHTALAYERSQAMRFDPSRWTMQLRLDATYEHTQNPARNATMVNGAVHGSWAMTRRHSLPGGFSLGYGGRTSLDVGLLYLSRNGNNPVSAKVAWTVDATAWAAWRGRLGRLPVTLRFQPSMPLAGAFFSPDYGQLYYQIYLGEDRGLAHAAWPGNYFSLDNLLTADLHLGNTSLRVGYHGTVLSTKVNNIVSRDISHALVLGVTIDWVSLSPTDRSLDRARLIQPM